MVNGALMALFDSICNSNENLRRNQAYVFGLFPVFARFRPIALYPLSGRLCSVLLDLLRRRAQLRGRSPGGGEAGSGCTQRGASWHPCSGVSGPDILRRAGAAWSAELLFECVRAVGERAKRGFLRIRGAYL